MEPESGTAFSRRSRRRRQKKPAGLNITSMMDMFTIILIFLLLNFAPDSADLKLDRELTLPSSTTERPYEEFIKVAVTRSEVLVGEDVVARVEAGELVGARMDGDTILPLRAALEIQRARIDDVEDAVVLFYADKDAEFRLVNQVMRSAASAGFPNFKFAVSGQ